VLWEEINLKKNREDLLIVNLPITFQKSENIYFKFRTNQRTAAAGFALLE
jgi:hypothetical protein